ncbi:hypothetical protein ACGFYZ_31375 [Streptomyces sp. NPDC048330]|uniref:hypothetical protein n=1 Tax=Streptomyces sp. NPDC048330 TaxID=3365533 RepID=UPI003721EBD6
MSVRARLRATVPAPLSAPGAAPPEITGQPGRRLVVQRSDEVVVAQALDDDFHARPGPAVRFPAPWPRGRGAFAVAPDAGLAVFAGVHAVRAVEPSGATRWEVRHGCWSGTCPETHLSYEEYADLPDHRYPDGGSAGFSADGTLVWAHVRGPLADGAALPGAVDEWLLLDAVDGRVRARVDSRSAAVGSFHLAHPTDPGQMGLSIGEGQDGAPLRWGRWDGQALEVAYLEDDLCLLSVSPSGDRLMTVSHDQDSLAVRDSRGAVAEGGEWDAASTVPRHPDAPPPSDDEDEDDEAPVYWDWAGGFVDETTLIVSTVESDEDWGRDRHWFVDTTTPAAVRPVVYPSPVAGEPMALGGGCWSTLSESRDSVRVWDAPTPRG